MSRLAFCVLAMLLGLMALCAVGAAGEGGVTAKLHPWGRFEPGTWKTVRVVTETINEQGEVVSSSVTDTKTTLVSIDSDGVALEVETCVEMGGKRFQSEPQTIRQGFHGETIGPNPTFKEPIDGDLTIENQKIPCKTQDLTIDSSNGKTTVSLWYSTNLAPYVLKRVSITTDADGKETVSETDTDVIALDMPVRVLGKTRGGAYVRTVYTTPKATVTTLAVVLSSVPGGVVSQSSKETDKNGRLVRRNTLELLDYNSDPDKDRSGLFRQKRSTRRSKTPPHYSP